ncbi:hypothetical protein SLS62_005380 [Diatrype stigma]|uniref:Uncharacterized protein n=1 Tax=Diatrype stigma TaxID=117547 RepID=A0AAN9USQ5_9PEZI
MASPDPKIPSTIAIRPPSKYVLKQSESADADAFVPPPLEWLYRTWAVTHSTLSMWRSAQNVRITYKPYKPSTNKPSSSPPLAIDDLVEYEKKGSGSGSGVKSVEGIDKPAADRAGSGSGSSSSPGGAWDWRGKGWLKIASSHWEVLGYGERPQATAAGAGDEEGGAERWVVTWFAPTLFTQEGLDIYSNRREGLSQETLDAIMKALKELGDAPKIVTLVEKHMQPVAISLPWQEGA